MNDEVHVMPIGANGWAVEVGKTSYQGFDSEEKALKFGRQMAAKSQGCKLILHDRHGNQHEVDQMRKAS